MLSRFLHVDDPKTWDAFRRGNHDAFTFIYQANFQALYRYGSKFCKDDALIADTLQQLFTELWHKKRKLGPANQIKNYLYKSFRRSLLRNLKEQNNKLSDQAITAFAFHVSYEAKLIQQELDKEQSEALNKAIRSLTEKQREVIYLKFYEGLSYAEISNVTGSTSSQVYDLMYKALGALRKQVKKGGNSTPLSSSALAILIITFLLPL